MTHRCDLGSVGQRRVEIALPARRIEPFPKASRRGGVEHQPLDPRSHARRGLWSWWSRSAPTYSDYMGRPDVRGPAACLSKAQHKCAALRPTEPATLRVLPRLPRWTTYCVATSDTLWCLSLAIRSATCGTPRRDRIDSFVTSALCCPALSEASARGTVGKSSQPLFLLAGCLLSLAGPSYVRRRK